MCLGIEGAMVIGPRTLQLGILLAELGNYAAILRWIASFSVRTATSFCPENSA